MDYGFHPPTIYFPLIVPEALMIEPTETESKETLDKFASALKKIVTEIKENPDFVKGAPYTRSVGRLDEVTAARSPNLRWVVPSPQLTGRENRKSDDNSDIEQHPPYSNSNSNNP
jgi:glycine cleavage system protein P-like pyridoxal-binding family